MQSQFKPDPLRLVRNAGVSLLLLLIQHAFPTLPHNHNCIFIVIEQLFPQISMFALSVLKSTKKVQEYFDKIFPERKKQEEEKLQRYFGIELFFSI